MKAILISIKPEWVAKILNGEKTIEIRKTMPKCDLPIDVYIYCTKGKYKMGKFNSDKKYHEIQHDCFYANGCLSGLPNEYLNGKVVAKFTLNKVEEITATEDRYGEETWYETYSLTCDELSEESCLDFNELDEYMYGKYGNAQGYAWHIDNLEIFDRPKELSEFHLWEKDKIIRLIVNNTSKLAGECLWKPLTKAPQNMCYIEIEDSTHI